MNSQPDHPDFSTILTTTNATNLLNRLIKLEDTSNFGSSYTNLTVGNKKLDAVAKTKLDSYLKISQQQWQWLNDVNTDNKIKNTLINTLSLQKNSEYALTDWLISLFNALFLGQQVELIRGEQEPEYFPTQGDKPARIVFAHGFFASALHEIHTPLYRLTCYKPLILIMYITTLLLSI
ncbi:elongation factor P hydroxylase [Psychrobacter sp. ASPA161_9]|uniref:elongation factor P hydroxylase n=1 Tax=Psychrobacter sp. ASPA161_9 TaxID=3160961 RepID=UPI003F7D5345